MSLFEIEKRIPSSLLYDRFIIPPFSVFDTRQGYWQDRKRAWINMGIKSELGRDDFDNTKYEFKNAEKGRKQPHMVYTRHSGLLSEAESADKYGRKHNPTSVFDPVLCEIAYKWFSREGDVILDPFAGGSVRGIVAGALNRYYYGVDLNCDQLVANNNQYDDISSNYEGIVKPIWCCGDSENLSMHFTQKADLIFTCPPYYNLEVYSTDERDLSYKRTYEEFLESYKQIIKNCVNVLNDNSFAIVVIQNIRDDNGAYYNIVGDTISAFQECGMILYNDCVIINVAGTLPIRAPGQFDATRKIGKQHQNFLVFYKGDISAIKQKYQVFDKKKKDAENTP